jgi:hypothetical protein
MVSPLFVGTVSGTRLTVVETFFRAIHSKLIDAIQAGRVEEAGRYAELLAFLAHSMQPRSKPSLVPTIIKTLLIVFALLYVLFVVAWLNWRTDDRFVAGARVASPVVRVAVVGQHRLDWPYHRGDLLRALSAMAPERQGAGRADAGGGRRRGGQRTDPVSRVFRWLLS